ncbi:electron transfer flavoprotein subunit alpha/FixB family protein [Hoyosella rhizosphaerae]|uniref:Electron transfer flavoprotein alpha-subunit FixB n=1 Tax=Hoyosella rhizosphaerae TaxID=1755582 RepID=A0A916U0R5_9ACTN|nr:electron transfer flavoprotein subunit alpha/FixB family protein [Hoyosella rhizosphaerae]MBN4927360.1 electron transfer flavoprotein subunit alpha/FixB family protein [Hoyosella rhizosphaerae]GGC51883.1 electron transfer flavoprotein alpha-subunit FixB [Hoyosella rhizosphaerae]
MAEVLVLVEHAEGTVKKVTSELLTVARTLGEPSAVVTGASGTGAALADSLKEAGAEKIYVAESDAFSNYLITPVVDVLADLVEQASPAAVLTAATAEGKEVSGRLAARLGLGLLADVIGVNGDGSVVHSIFGGAFTVDAKASGVPIISLRPGAVDAEPQAGAGEQVSVEVAEPEDGIVKITSREPVVAGDRPDLAEASVVVSGGRGVGSADKFSVVEELADILGGAVGASRAAVDSGYYPGQFQVGQTGKTVSPNLYIALGISGAIQHRAGMQTSKTIVAVNKDEEAPIFEIADYGIVGDLFDVAPQLTEAVKKRKG